MHKRLINILTATAMLCLLQAVPALAQIPSGYYDSLKGKKGSALKMAVYDIIKTANVLNYGSGEGKTWSGFYKTDRRDDNSVVDRYSYEDFYFTSTTSAVSGMNIEHSFPKSWWGGSKNQAYQDLYNLMPCEQKINSSKSNYPMGKVTTTKTTNGCTNIGTGSNGYQLWEPADTWKGDFARGYMYMATAYQNYTWSGTQALQILQQGTYPTLQEWAYKLYIEWAKDDPVDELELKRNNAVCLIQGNRNPYVDFPNLMEYVWGDSVDYAFDPSTTYCPERDGYSGGDDDPDTPQESEETLYDLDLLASDGGFTTEDDATLSFDVWTQNSSYGWTGTAYKSKKRYVADSYLVSPEVDLTDYDEANLCFDHIVNYCTTPTDWLSVEVRCEGTTTTLSDFTWPAGNSWTKKNSGFISLSDFAGKKIQIAFHYTSDGTTDNTSTWEVQTFTVTAKKHPATAINEAPVATPAPAEYYDLNGRRLSPDAPHKGIIIIRQGGKARKVVR